MEFQLISGKILLSVITEKDRRIEIEMSPSESLVLIFQTPARIPKPRMEVIIFQSLQLYPVFYLVVSKSTTAEQFVTEPDFREVTLRQIFAQEVY